MKQIFISIPMTGCLDESQKREIEVKEILKSKYPLAELVSGFDVYNEYTDETDAFYMGKDIKALLESNAIVSVGNWRKSKGCRVERYTAEMYGIPCYEIMDDNVLREVQNDESDIRMLVTRRLNLDDSLYTLDKKIISILDKYRSEYYNELDKNKVKDLKLYKFGFQNYDEIIDINISDNGKNIIFNYEDENMEIDTVLFEINRIQEFILDENCVVKHVTEDVTAFKLAVQKEKEERLTERCEIQRQIEELQSKLNALNVD